MRIKVWSIVAVSVLAAAAASVLQAHEEIMCDAPQHQKPDSVAKRLKQRTCFEAQEKIPLEKRQYIKNMKILGRAFAGEEAPGKMQMMVLGDKRYLIQGRWGPGPGRIIDVSDPTHPVVANDNAWPAGGQVQVAYHQRTGRWLLVVSSQVFEMDAKGLRGVSIYDITDPKATRLVSKWSVDGGSPDRPMQTGSGPHRNYWDGGDYLYLTTAPDNNFYTTPENQEVFWLGYNHGLQVVDISDPSKPKLVSNAHYPGQRADEAAQRAAWPFASDDLVYTMMHGPAYVPKRVEDGGRFGYMSGGGFGLLIFDLADIKQPKLAAEWRPDPYVPGPAIAAHTVDVARLDRGFVIVSPEELFPGCVTKRHETYIVDVSNPLKPTTVSMLPAPLPPKEAPYDSFCKRAGRFGTHNPPHLKAPGKAAPNFTCYAYFNAGLQCYDITDPRKPFVTSYFVTEQHGAALGDGLFADGSRTVDNVFIEWDRKVIWVASDTGLYALSATALGKPVLKPMPVSEWALPDINRGAR